MKAGLGIFGLSVALVSLSLLLIDSSNEGAASNAGEIGAAGLVCLVIGAVMVSRALQTRDDPPR